MAEYKRMEPDLSFVRGVMATGGDTVKRCYQCATCSVVCPLSGAESPFPRKEMLWAQWGLASKVAGDADVWLCHQCGDCTSHCPRGARPGDVLSAIRANAIRYYAWPRGIADVMGKPAGVIGVVIAVMIVVVGVLALIGNLGIPEGDVVYHKLLSVLPIDAIFMPLAGFAVVVGGRGILNFWRDLDEGAGLPKSYTGTAPRPTVGDLLKEYLWPSFLEILNHERFKKCGVTADRARGHLWLLWSFLILFFVTNYVFIGADVFGMETPLSLFHPVKILANVGAVMMIGGIWLIKQMRDQKTAQGDLKSVTQDWILIWLIFAVGATGIGAELLRLVNVGAIAYPVYVLHLGCVGALFLSLPYTKFAHLLYRTTAYVHQMWAADVVAGKVGFGKKA